jgi:hypothetical protein
MNWNLCERKLSWCVCSTVPGICLKELKETTGTSVTIAVDHSRDSKRAPPEHKSEASSIDQPVRC